MAGPAATPTTNQPAIISTPDYLCSLTDEYSYCVPNKKGGDYFIAISAKPSETLTSEVERIQKWFFGSGELPEPAGEMPAGIKTPSSSHIYKITHLIPEEIRTYIGTTLKLPGPNCFDAAFIVSKPPGFDTYPRYVGSKELAYHLIRDFEPAPCNIPDMSGVLYLYHQGGTYSAAEHAAFHIFGGIGFHKGGWEDYFPYKHTSMKSAMDDICTYWRPDDRFGSWKCPIKGSDFVPSCWKKRAAPLERATSASPEDINWFLPLFNYYNARVENIVSFAEKWPPSDKYRAARMDLLTAENMWKLGRKYSDVLGPDATMKLIAKDEKVAKAYLKLDSLIWQYQVMNDKFDPLGQWDPMSKLKKLYECCYVRFDDRFDEELNLYLKLLGVPESEWEKMRAQVKERFKKFDPVTFAETNGGTGIPYLEIVEDVVKHRSLAVPRKITPVARTEWDYHLLTPKKKAELPARRP